MTTHELAKKLLEKPDKMAIMAGYEGGVNEITQVGEIVTIHLNVNDEWYYGKHELPDYRCEDGCNHEVAEAIMVS